MSTADVCAHCHGPRTGEGRFCGRCGAPASPTEAVWPRWRQRPLASPRIATTVPMEALSVALLVGSLTLGTRSPAQGAPAQPTPSSPSPRPVVLEAPTSTPMASAEPRPLPLEQASPSPTATATAAAPSATATPLPTIAARTDLIHWLATATAIPNNPVVLLNLGIQQYRVGNYEEALRLFDQAQALDKQGRYAFYIHFNRAPTLNLLGRTREGIAEATTAIDIARTTEQQLAAKQPGKMSPALQQAQGLLASALNNRGLLYKSENNFTGALADFTEGLKLRPNYDDLLDSRGDLYRLMGDRQNALQQLNRAILVNPHSDSAYYDRGMVYEALGKNALAIRDFQKEIVATDVKAYQDRAAAELAKLQRSARTPSAG